MARECTTVNQSFVAVTSMGTSFEGCCAFPHTACAASCPDKMFFHSEQTFCTQPWTPRRCSYRGTCVNGVCHCDKGYHGEHCDMISQCQPNDFWEASYTRPPFCGETTGVNVTIRYPRDPVQCSPTISFTKIPLPQHGSTPCLAYPITHATLLDAWYYALPTARNRQVVRYQDLLSILRESIDGADVHSLLRPHQLATQEYLRDLILHHDRQIVRSGPLGPLGSSSPNPNCTYNPGPWIPEHCPPATACDHLQQVRVNTVDDGDPNLCNDVIEIHTCALSEDCFHCQIGEWSEWTPCPDPEECIDVMQYRYKARWSIHNISHPARCGVKDPFVQNLYSSEDDGPLVYDDDDDGGATSDSMDAWYFYDNGFIQGRQCPIATICDACTKTDYSNFTDCPPPETCPRGIKHYRVRNLLNRRAMCHPPDNPMILMEADWCPIAPECDVCHVTGDFNYTHWNEWALDNSVWSECPDPYDCLHGVRSYHQRQFIDAVNPAPASICPNVTYTKECPVAPTCQDLPWGCLPTEWFEWEDCPDIQCIDYHQTRYGIQFQNITERVCRLNDDTRQCPGPKNNLGQFISCSEATDKLPWTDFPPLANISQWGGPFDNITIPQFRIEQHVNDRLVGVEQDHEQFVNNVPVPILSEWSNWTDCPPEVCVDAFRTRARNVLWAGDWIQLSETETLQTEQCPIPFEICYGQPVCNVTEDWLTFDECVGTCTSGGFRFEIQKTRTLLGDICDTEVRNQTCPLAHCDDPCLLGSMHWSQCYGECGTGVRFGTRSLVRGTDQGCDPMVITEPCDTHEVCTPTQECSESEWSDWSLCLVNPNLDHFQFRHRTMLLPGSNCSHWIESRACMEPFRTDMLNITIDFEPCELTEWADVGGCTSAGQFQVRTMQFPGHSCGKMFRVDTCSGVTTIEWINSSMAVFAMIVSSVTLTINYTKPSIKKKLQETFIAPTPDFQPPPEVKKKEKRGV